MGVGVLSEPERVRLVRYSPSDVATVTAEGDHRRQVDDVPAIGVVPTVAHRTAVEGNGVVDVDDVAHYSHSSGLFSKIVAAR